MRRREFVIFLSSIGAWSLVEAQEASKPVIGFLSSRSPTESAYVLAAFRQGLREAGFVEGENVTIAFRWAEGNYGRLSSLASELVDLRVALLFAAGGPPAALSAKAATSTIPIVFSAANDPVQSGLVASLARPGGNITGMATLTTGLASKSGELMKELIPKAAVIAYLLNPSSPNAGFVSQEARSIATALKIQAPVLNASTEQEIEAAFDRLGTLHADALIVYGDPFFDSRREKIVGLAAQRAIPASYAWREYVLSGGLMSYGTSLTDSYREAGVYVGRILKGEKPGDLPVQEPTKFELAINQTTAKALGLAIPQSILLRADEVME
jgi:ABC-type uncharacterized transport system substrate-binding protein